MPEQRNELIDRTISALLWVAAFSFATGIFLSATLLLRSLPPTRPVAVGRVTVEHASKARDYAGAALFFVLIAPLTIVLHDRGKRINERLRSRLAFRRNRSADFVSLLFIAPFFLAPFLFLTTQKWGWPVVIPLVLSFLLTYGVIAFETTAWIRALFRAEMRPFHALIAAEALSWIVFRYIETGRRIAHIPTLFLEITFVVFFVGIFWCAFLTIARIAQFALGTPADIALQRIAIGAMPLVVLPLLGLAFVDARVAILTVMALVLVGMTIAPARPIRRTAMYVVIPLLLYCISYVTSAATSQSVDLFHRGESLGPASDYLHGKAPYRDVFVLHGLLSDGLLDAWLMQIFGREELIVLARPALLGSFAAPALWLLACAIFDSIPIAAIVMVLGVVTTVDTERALFEIAAVALLIAGLRSDRRRLFLLSGLVAGVAIFFSLDIGLYCVGGALLALLVLKRFRAIAPFAIGVLLGAAPFVVYLAARGVFGAFLDNSFRAVPAIIDAVWSLPFPDLMRTFRYNLDLHTISDFILFERFRFVLNPLVIGIALVCIVWRRLRGKLEWLDVALIVLTAFAVLTQRSALGRSDFPHQYFSAFLIAPMLVILFAFVARAPRVIVVGAAVALFPVMAVALWLPDVVNARIDDATHYVGRIKQGADPPTALIRARIESVRHELNLINHPGQTMFDFSNQPALYFFSDRRNPTRFYQVPLMSPPEYQREVITALERAKPLAVVRSGEFAQFDDIDNDIRAQAVAAYLDDHYAYVTTRFGVEIWKRKPGIMPADVNGYLRRIRVPSLKELGILGTRNRLVFPYIASSSGGNGTYWRSDLTLYNPLAVPMRLRLRYIAADRRVDREVVLAPHRNIRWDDVVQSLFQAAESGGVVWIEYHGDRAPVARARTFDVAHDRGGQIAEPMTIADSATAHSDRDELSVIGFSARHIQINLGVVNVGDSPMTFRMTIATASGVVTGRTVQQMINEGEAYIVSDAEKALGVQLDPTMTAQVQVTGGRAVAFASTLEANGDTAFLAGVPSSRK